MSSRSKGRHIITLEIEHPATLEVCRFLEKNDFEVSYLPVNDEGILELDVLREALRPDTVLVSVMHANNEIGSIQPVAEIGKLAQKYGFLFHSDAAQSAGKLKIDVRKMGVHLLSIAGHKLYGPKGIGALYVKDGTSLEKLIHGADHEANRRAGTENVPLIAGLGKACELVSRNLDTYGRHMHEMRDRLWDRMQADLPGIHRNGSRELCLPNTLNISFPGIDSQMILSGMPEIAVSAGAACHSEQQEISHVLKAIGLPNELALGTLRFSTGRDTTTAEIDAAADAPVQVP